jgi:predicted ArsR family transcriptional regulator
MRANPAWTESLLEFVRRAGPVTTVSVARRFGWNTRAARAKLHRLSAQGLLDYRRENFADEGGGGAVNGWWVKDTKRDKSP